MSLTRQHCLDKDAADPLRQLRDRFALPEKTIYLDGNSLGALPKATPDRLQSVVCKEWGNDLIQSWNTHEWIDYPTRIGERIAVLIGAAPGQVLCTDTVSGNLFKALAAALAANPGRTTILSIRDNFPTDLYIAQGLASLLGRDRCRVRTVARDELAGAIDDDVAVLMLTEVDFRTGERLDMAAWTNAAHERGALALWDLSHSAGAMPITLDACGVDFAVGCGYKFLNGGPGAPAFVYAAERHHEHAQPLSGWMGHASPFDFASDYEPAAGIRRFASGTPSILAMVALDAALDVFDGIDLQLVRAKSLDLADTFIARVEQSPALAPLALASPRVHNRRGSQVCYRFEHAYPAIQALIAEGVIGDFRQPDILRFGLAPLYTRHVDVFDAVTLLAGIFESGRWREPAFNDRARVT